MGPATHEKLQAFERALASGLVHDWATLKAEILKLRGMRGPDGNLMIEVVKRDATKKLPEGEAIFFELPKKYSCEYADYFESPTRVVFGAGEDIRVFGEKASFQSLYSMPGFVTREDYSPTTSQKAGEQVVSWLRQELGLT